MALQFQAPFNIDPYAESPTERKLARLNQTMSTIGNEALQYRQQQIERKRQDMLMKMQQQQNDIARENFYNENGYYPGQTPPSTSDMGYSASPVGGMSMPSTQGASPSGSLQQGTTGPQVQPNMSLASGGQGYAAPGAVMPVDLTSHFQSWKAQGMPMTYNHPDFGGTSQDLYGQMMRIPGRKNQEAFLGARKQQQEEAFRQSEIEKNRAMAEMYSRGGPQAGKGTWKINPFTGSYEWYPNAGPGAAGPSRVSGQPPSSPSTQPGSDIPFSPGMTYQQRAKLTQEKPKALGSLTNTLREYDNMINEANAIKNDPALGMATGMTSFTTRISGSPTRRVGSRLETLKAKTLLNVLSSLKELSSTGASGFGQLSNIEGENIRNSISTLDNGMQKGDFQESLNRFISEMEERKKTLVGTFDKTYGPSGLSGGPSPSGGANEVMRRTNSGRMAVFDANTRQFLRWSDGR